MNHKSDNHDRININPSEAYTIKTLFIAPNPITAFTPICPFGDHY